MSSLKWRSATLKPQDVTFREARPIEVLSVYYAYPGAKGVDQKGEVVTTVIGSVPAFAGKDYIVQGSLDKFPTVMTIEAFKAKYEEAIDIKVLTTVSSLIPSIHRKGKRASQYASQYQHEQLQTISHKDLIETAQKAGLSEDETLSCLRKLMRDGSIYEPKQGFYRQVQ